MVWLTSQSVWFLVVGCLVIAIAVAFGSRYVALWILPQRDREEAHSIAAALMTAFAAAFALLTALTLANEASSRSSAADDRQLRGRGRIRTGLVVDQPGCRLGACPGCTTEPPRCDANVRVARSGVCERRRLPDSVIRDLNTNYFRS
jgi:hypothetical protein